MGIDEEGTVAQLKALRKTLFDPKVAEHRGRIVKNTGDGALVEFASVVDAVRCADEIQRGMAEQNTNVPQTNGSNFVSAFTSVILSSKAMISLATGSTLPRVSKDLADPGGILVSGTAYDYVKNKIKVGFDDLGAQTLKNIAEPVRVYRITGTPRVAIAEAGPHPANLRSPYCPLTT